MVLRVKIAPIPKGFPKEVLASPIVSTASGLYKQKGGLYLQRHFDFCCRHTPVMQIIIASCCRVVHSSLVAVTIRYAYGTMIRTHRPTSRRENIASTAMYVILVQ